MQHLQELGLDTSNASMYWISYNGISVSIPGNFHLPTSDNDYVICDAYSLQDVLDALPKCITNDRGCIAILVIDFGDDKIGYYFKHDCAHIGWVWKSFAPKRIYDIGGEKPPRLLDTAYALLCWAIENKFVETNKNE